MKRFFCTLFVLLAMVCNVNAAYLVFSPNGAYVAKASLTAALTDADTANKHIVNTTPNAVISTAITLSGGRTFENKDGGCVTYSGSGALTGLPEASPTDFCAKGDGTTDDTTAITRAIAASPSVVVKPGNYVVTDSITYRNTKTKSFLGSGRSTIFTNKAAAGKPTFLLDSTEYIEIGNFAIAGRATFPNDAIWMNSVTNKATMQSAYTNMHDILMQPNGNGLFLQKTNTNYFDRVDYWPSGGPAIGATVDSGTRKFAVYTDANVAADFANDLHFNNCNLLGVDPTIPGHAIFRFYTGAVSNSITIENCEMEGNLTSGLFTNIWGLTLKGNFLENSSMTLQNVRYARIHGYNLKTFVADSCAIVILDNVVMGDAAASATFNSNCTFCGAVNSTIQTYTNNSARPVTQNVISANSGIGGYIPDQNNIMPIQVAFNAANFSGLTSMTWTVASGDQKEFSYVLQGKMMTMFFSIETSTVGGTPSSALKLAVPGGKTIASTNIYNPISVKDATNTVETGFAQAAAGNTFIYLYRAGNATWTASTDTTEVHGQITFGVD